ncbi:putative Nodulin like [Trypanosoma vivax]|nr:putative Nodulin like [Trypanosoma vivax]
MASAFHQTLFIYDTTESVAAPDDEQDVSLSSEDGELSSEVEEVSTLSTHLLTKGDVSRTIHNYASTNEHCGRSGVSEPHRPRPSARLTHFPTKRLSESGRFCRLVVAVLCCFVVSSYFSFNLYSGRLQSKYNFTQNQITTITSTSDLLSLLTLPFGSIYDDYGAWPVFLGAIVTYPLGSILYSLTFSDIIGGTLPGFAIYSTMLSVGTSLLDMGGVMTLLSIFPVSRGAVVAIMKAITGMGSAIIGLIHLAFFSMDGDAGAARFFIFLAVVGTFISLLCLVFLEVPPYIIKGKEEATITKEEKKSRARLRRLYLRQRPPPARFAVGFGIAIILAIFLPVQGILTVYMKLDHWYHVVFACVSIGLFVLYPLMALPDGMLERSHHRHSDSISGVESSCFGHTGHVSRVQSFISQATSASLGSEALLRDLEYISPQYQTTVSEGLRTRQLWALLWTLFCIGGAEIVILSNVRFVLSALGEESLDDTFVALLVVLIGVGSGLGRISLSVIEMMIQKRPTDERTPITVVLFIPTAVITLSLVLLLILPSKLLPLPCFIIAFGSGCDAAAAVLVLRTIYAKDVAKHYNCTAIAGVAASILINRVVYGETYSHEAEKNGNPVCLNRDCVLLPLFVCLFLCSSSLLSALYVHIKYSQYCCKMLEIRKRHLEPSANEITVCKPTVDMENCST